MSKMLMYVTVIGVVGAGKQATTKTGEISVIGKTFYLPHADANPLISVKQQKCRFGKQTRKVLCFFRPCRSKIGKN